MSEELRQKGYLARNGQVQGDALGPYESFNLGNSTLSQLKNAAVVPARSYGTSSRLKPDALVVDRRPGAPRIRLVVEYKDRGELSTSTKREAVFNKVASTYCALLGCELAAISDGVDTYWLLADPSDGSWRPILREDGYPLDLDVDLASATGRDVTSSVLERIDTELDRSTATLVPPAAVNPTRLAEQVWQTIWLASGENPDTCLASFIEILIFKYFSDLRILDKDPNGIDVSFGYLQTLRDDQVLRYYFDHVRPEIHRLFPPGQDGTSVINGTVLDPNNMDHGRLFAEILNRFTKFGSLRRIDPEFKSRIFERFLRESISKKNWGQYFTPRNVVKAMIEMSGIDHLPAGAKVGDPACGVGGFVLEPLVHKRPYDFRPGASSSLQYRGWDRDQKTIILAKANMLIHLSDVLEKDPSGAPALLAPVLNETFSSTHTSITGSLSRAPSNEFDLIMTNPPYVVTGTSTQRAAIAADRRLAAYYDVPGSGVENLFLQLVIQALKPGARALVVLPDGLLVRHTEESLRRHLLQECDLEAIISLPKNTFYSTPKKTYVVIFRKKHNSASVQRKPVFTYTVTDVGETLDAKRFVIPANDLLRAAQLFRIFAADPSAFDPAQADDLKLRVYDIESFYPEQHWLVDRWLSKEEQHELGILDSGESIAPGTLAERLADIGSVMSDLAGMLTEKTSVPTTVSTRAISLGDDSLFRLSIGMRVLKKDLFGRAPGPIPLYSANVNVPFGYVDKSTLSDFSRPSVLFGIDGDFELAVKEPSVEFSITDHCGRIEVLVDDLDPNYCRAAIALARAQAFDRTLRASLRRIRQLSIEVPVDGSGAFDLEAQRALAARYDSVTASLQEAEVNLRSLLDLEPEVLSFDVSADQPEES